MIYSDVVMARLEYERRLQEIAQARFAQQMAAQQAPKQNRFGGALGVLLTLAGAGLKGWDVVHYPSGR